MGIRGWRVVPAFIDLAMQQGRSSLQTALRAETTFGSRDTRHSIYDMDEKGREERRGGMKCRGWLRGVCPAERGYLEDGICVTRCLLFWLRQHEDGFHMMHQGFQERIIIAAVPGSGWGLPSLSLFFRAQGRKGVHCQAQTRSSTGKVWDGKRIGTGVQIFGVRLSHESSGTVLYIMT